MRGLWLSVALLGLLAGCGPQPAPPTVTPVPSPTVLQVTPTDSNQQPPTPTLPPTLTPQPTPAGRASVRTVHLMPGLPAVDAYIDNTAVAFGVEYGEVVGQAELDAGAGMFRLVGAGGRVDAAALVASPVTLTADAAVVALALPDGQVAFVNEDMAPLGAGMGRVRFVHAVDGAPPVRFALDGQALPSTPPVGYGGQSAVWERAAGDYDVSADGWIDPFTVTLAAGKSQTVVVHGAADAPQIMTFDADVPQRVTLQVLNLSEQAGPVDVYLNDALALEALDVVATAGRVDLSAETYTVTFYQAGVDPDEVEPLLTGRVVMNPDDVVFAMLIGPAFDLQLVTYQPDERPTPFDRTRITFVNAISETPRLEEVRNDAVQIALAYAQPTQIELPAGRLEFEFVTDLTENDYTFVELVAVQEFEPGVSYLIPLLGEQTDGRAERVMFEQVVGAEEAPVTETPQPPQVYVVNATDRALQVVLDGVLVESELVPGAATQFVELAAGRRPLAITESQSREVVFSTERLFEQDRRYTLLVYGEIAANNFTVGQFEGGDLLTAALAEGAAAVRLVNGSLLRDQQLAVARSPVAQGQPPLRATATAAAAAGGAVVGEQLPGNAIRLPETAVGDGLAGPWLAVPQGIHNLYVYDVDSGEVMGVARGATLGEGAFYEVFVAQPGGGTADGVFVAAYTLHE